MKLILIALMSLSSWAHTSKIICKSHGFAGDNVKRAIETCAQYSRFNRGQCARAVNCNEYRTHCQAGGIAGDSVLEAMHSCAQYTRISRQDCARQVSCR